MNKGRRSFFADLCLVALLIALGVVMLLPKGENGQTVEIRINGELYGAYSLAAENRIEIVEDGVLLGVAVIEDGTVRMEEAVCGGKDCEKSGRISEAGRCIVCLPNGVTVAVRGEGGLDGVTG